MKCIKTYLYIFIVMFTCRFTYATHIVGGELSYDKLTGNDYRIHLDVYRDCINGIPPFDSPAFFTIFDANSIPIYTLSIPLTYSINVPPTINNACSPNILNIACVEKGVYEFTVSLAPLAGGYYIAYQRCCRNGTILNLINPGAVGSTYWEHIPGPEVVTDNSSPRFSLLPPIYICNNNPIAFNHVATDPDGDSLVYNLCTPYDGLNQVCPMLWPPSPCLPENEPPPYTPVPFLPPYNASYPMSSNPIININNSTGFLNGTPNVLGQWVVGVCVSEYRNGQLIGVHYRDFQFNVVPCPFVINADVVSQFSTNNGAGTGYCNGFNILFTNNSSPNSTSFLWDFGVPGITTDTSHAKNPTFAFPNIGDYTVTLIVNPGDQCSDTAYKVFHIYPLLAPTIATLQPQCLYNNHFTFSADGSYLGTGTFAWDFGNNASPNSATTETVTSVIYNTPGTYTISLSIAENGCSASSTSTVIVYPTPAAALIATTNACINSIVSFTNTSSNALSYVWHFGDGQQSTNINSTHSYSVPGTYTVSLIAANINTCVYQDTATHIITIHQPTLSATSHTICIGQSATIIANGGNTYLWDNGSTSANIVVTPTISQNYSVQGFDANNCVNSTTCSVAVNALPLLTVNSSTICFGDNTLLTVNGAINYVWQTGATSSSISVSPPTTTVITVQGTDVNGCSNTVTTAVQVNPLPQLSVSPQILCEGDVTTISAFGAVTYTWNTGVIANSFTISPLATTLYTVIGTDINNCMATYTTTLNVFPKPLVSCNNATICNGQVATVSANGATSYTWSTGTIGNSISVNPATTFSYVVTGELNGCTNTDTSIVIVNPLPVMSVNSPTICEAQNTNLIVNGALTYAWSSGSFNDTITVTPLITTTYSVIGSTIFGCTSVLTTTIFVNPPISSTANDLQLICVGDTKTLSANAIGGNGGPYSYSWLPYSAINTPSILVSPMVESTYSVVITDGCSLPIIKIFTVQIVSLPIALPTADTLSGCPPLCINFQGSVLSSSVPITSWNWSFDTIANIQSPQYCFNTTGNYTASLLVVDSNGCKSQNSNVLSITVYPSPTASFTPNTSTVSYYNPEINFTNQSLNYLTSSWDFGDYNYPNNTSTIINPSHVYSEPGTYCIYLIVTNSLSCVDKVTQCIEVIPEFTFYIPNTFTPNNSDDINNVFTGKGIGIVKYEMWIFDRWGEEIYYTNDITKGWDGKVRGKEGSEKQDVYVWTVRLRDVFEKTHSYIGHVTILR